MKHFNSRAYWFWGITLFVLITVAVEPLPAQEKSSFAVKSSVLSYDHMNNNLQNNSLGTKVDPALIYPNRASLLSYLNTIVPTVFGAIWEDNMHGRKHIVDGLSITGGITMGYGLLVGPATGHLYARNYEQAIWGTLLRSVSGVAGRFGVVGSFRCTTYLYDCDPIRQRALNLLAIAGTLSFTYKLVYDVIKADDAAVKYNKKIIDKKKITFYPYMDPSTGAKGMKLRVNF